MIAAIVLAAGRSTRMGQPKLLLPWGNVTVIGQVVSTLKVAGMKKIIVVTGPASEQIEQALYEFAVQVIANNGYAQCEMLSSIQVGVRALEPDVTAALIVLGDQPQMKADTVRALLAASAEIPSALLVPSYRGRRGHPWLVERALWPDLLALAPPHTPRDFLNAHAAEIRYIDSPDDSILRDLDTPEDYERDRPQIDKDQNR